jgi:hypothetical protein
LIEGLLERAKAFLKSIMSWANRFDGKLAKIKRMAGMVTEGKTIAHYDELARQRKEQTLTASKLVKKLNDSSMSQAVVDDIKKIAMQFDGELDKADMKDIIRLSKVSKQDGDEIMDIVGL